MNLTVTIVCAVLAGATLLTAIVPIIIGKVKLRRAVTPVEYYPPRGFSPIDVLIKYYGFHANTHELLNAIMLYWADRGYITIEEDCKRGLKLTKLRDLKPTNAKSRFGAGVSEYDFDWFKIQNFETEKALFDGIFADGKVFYTLAAKAEHNKKNSKFVRECKSRAKEEKSKLTKRVTLVAFLVAIASVICATITCAAVTGGGPLYMTMLFTIIALIGFRFIPNIIAENEDKGNMVFIMYPFFAVWGGAPFGALMAFSPAYAAVPLGLTVLVAAFSILVLNNKIDIREEKDLAVYGLIRAFKKFLLEVEADRINTLVEENPNYYYDILPYCYILKITKKMKAKFDHVALDGPSWYLGDLRNTLMF